jgi:HAD superfamily hydrolase (TIGR01509 family)
MQDPPYGPLEALLRTVAAALFDFDGVIADTEPCQAKSYTALLADHGIDFTVEDFERYVGTSELAIYEELERTYGIELDVDQVRPKRAKYLIDAILTTGLQPYPYVYRVLARLEELGSPAFVVSSNAASTIRPLLDHWALEKRFERILTVFDFDKPVSKPELVNAAPLLVGYDPQQLILFEDSPVAIAAGRKLKMRTVGVINSLNPEPPMDADLVIDAANDTIEVPRRV